MSDPFDFEPIYANLFAQLVASGSVTFLADAVNGDPVLRNVKDPCGDTDTLLPGLAVIAPNVPLGACILTVDSESQITLTLPVTADTTQGSYRAGFTDGCSRILRHWADVQQSEQPVLYQTQISEKQEKRTGQPGKWELDCKVYLYATAPSDRTPITPAMNALLARIRGVFQRDASGPGRMENRCTLSGTCFDAWIEGKIETDEGVLGQQGVAIIPVHIIAMGP
jgi:hypothetical protein